MKDDMLLRKICSIHASDLHFATVIFPFIHKEIKNGTTIKTILENDVQENIEKILENIGLSSEMKDEIRNIDWQGTNINKIRKNFKLLEEEIKNKKKIDIIISGRNLFMQKVNQAIDLWVKNNIEKLQRVGTQLNIINCYSFDENKNANEIMDSHEYILKTVGLEEILGKEKLQKAN